MAKRQKKSIVDLMSKAPQPKPEILEEGVKKIHKAADKQKTAEKKEKTIRVTVDTPASLHKELKKIIIDEGVDLKTFYLQAVREKCQRDGHTIPE